MFHLAISANVLHLCGTQLQGTTQASNALAELELTDTG